MPTFYTAPTANFIQKTLSGAITDVATTITLNNTTSLTTPAYTTIDRTDSAGTSTPNAREVIYYTGISGNDLTGVTRGADGSTARSHSDGAVVETMPTVGMWNSLTTIVATAMTSDGYLKAILSPVSISASHFNTAAIISLASVQQLAVGTTKQTLTTDTDGATITFNMNTSNLHTVTLAGNRTLAVSNVAVGQCFVIRLVQDGTGSRTITWFSTIKWIDGITPTLTTTASKIDTFGFLCTSSGNYDGYIIGQNL